MSSKVFKDTPVEGGGRMVIVISGFTHTYHKFVCVVPQIVYDWEIEGEVELIKYVRKHGVKSIHLYKEKKS